MRKLYPVLAAAAALAFSGHAFAALPVGAVAPNFDAVGAKAGRDVSFSLREALRRGPVVLYFYPKAFTQGCTLEAHAFAEASPQFSTYGATVIGMSSDDLPTLRRFSKEACRDRFTVGVASPAIMRSYDVELRRLGISAGITDRTSYVIAPNGKITLAYTNLDYRGHVVQTLAAVRALSRK